MSGDKKENVKNGVEVEKNEGGGGAKKKKRETSDGQHGEPSPRRCKGEFERKNFSHVVAGKKETCAVLACWLRFCAALCLHGIEDDLTTATA